MADINILKSEGYPLTFSQSLALLFIILFSYSCSKPKSVNNSIIIQYNQQVFEAKRNIIEKIFNDSILNSFCIKNNYSKGTYLKYLISKSTVKESEIKRALSSNPSYSKIQVIEKLQSIKRQHIINNTIDSISQFSEIQIGLKIEENGLKQLDKLNNITVGKGNKTLNVLISSNCQECKDYFRFLINKGVQKTNTINFKFTEKIANEFIQKLNNHSIPIQNLKNEKLLVDYSLLPTPKTPSLIIENNLVFNKYYYNVDDFIVFR